MSTKDHLKVDLPLDSPKRLALNKLWHIYGNRGKNTTFANRKFIQGLLVQNCPLTTLHKCDTMGS